MSAFKLFPPDALTALATSIMSGCRCADAEASTIACNLVEANLTGHDSHGVGLLPDYVRLVRDGLAIANQELRVVKDSGAVLVLDAARGFGQVMGAQAMDLGMRKADEIGAAIVALRHSSHLGRIGAWAERCAARGFTSVHFVNGIDHAPLQAVFGGRNARLSTDPFCVGIPGEDGPMMLLDMATSRIAVGKARVARNKGVPVPDGCLLDPEGRPTDDPGVMFATPKGALIAMGEHKGSGLAIMCEMLAGALTGGGTIQPETEQRGGIVNNMLSIIVAPGALDDDGKVRHEGQALAEWIKASLPREGVGEVLLPGEPEARMRLRRRAEGIPIDRTSLDHICEAGASVGVDRATLDAALA